MPPARFESHGAVGEIVIAHPPLNLFGPAMLAPLREAIAAARDASPRALILRAEGDVFSAGADVHIFDGLDAVGADQLTGGLIGLAPDVGDLPFPTLAVVHGLCLTAGLEVSLACDLMWAAEEAKFGLVEAVVGITPSMGGTQRFAERAGTARAREFVMTGELYDAATLERWNVVNRVLAGDGFDDAARAFAQRLASGPTRAHAATKRIVRAQADGGARA